MVNRALQFAGGCDQKGPMSAVVGVQRGLAFQVSQRVISPDCRPVVNHR
jgi:hypothetical protein